MSATPALILGPPLGGGGSSADAGFENVSRVIAATNGIVQERVNVPRQTRFPSPNKRFTCNLRERWRS